MSKVNTEIAVQERREFGKNASRRARKAGQIPVSVYSKGKESRSFLIDADEWKVLSGHGAHTRLFRKAGKARPTIAELRSDSRARRIGWCGARRHPRAGAA